jgi:hypothetical protein
MVAVPVRIQFAVRRGAVEVRGSGNRWHSLQQDAKIVGFAGLERQAFPAVKGWSNLMRPADGSEFQDCGGCPTMDLQEGG